MGSSSVGPLTLPTQVSPPDFALSEHRPHALTGVEVLALPVLPGAGAGEGDDRGSPLLGPGAAEVADQLGVDLLALLEMARATGRAGEVTTFPVPLGGPENDGAALRAAGRRRRAAPAGLPAGRGGPGPGRPRPGLGRDDDPRAVAGGRPRGVRRRRDARLLRVPLALHASRAPARAPHRAGRPARPRRAGDDPVPRRRGRRRRLARAPAGDRPVEPEEPRSGWPSRPARSRPSTASPSRSGTSSGSPPRASAASSASAGPRPRRPG